MPDPVRVGVVGLGTVGSGVVRLLVESADHITRHAGRPIVVERAVCRDVGRDRGLKLAPDRVSTDIRTISRDPSISVAALTNAGLLLSGLISRGIYTPQQGWIAFSGRLALALLAMAALLWFAVPRFDWVALKAQPLLRMVLALGLVGGAAALYLGILLALGLRPRQFLRKT
jgi:hypothetical protein